MMEAKGPIWLTKLDADGKPTGELFEVGVSTLWADAFEDIPAVKPLYFPSMTRTSTMRYPRKWRNMNTDLHPDSLVVSDEYYFRPAGWYVVDVVGRVMKGLDVFYTDISESMQEALMAVTVMNEDQQYETVLWARYHHPSLDYLKEVARQIRSGERLTFIDGTEAIVSHTRVSLWTGGDLRPVETVYRDSSQDPRTPEETRP